MLDGGVLDGGVEPMVPVVAGLLILEVLLVLEPLAAAAAERWVFLCLAAFFFVVVVLLVAPVEPAVVEGLMVEPLVDPPAPVVCAAAGSARARDRIPLMIKVVRI